VPQPRSPNSFPEEPKNIAVIFLKESGSPEGAPGIIIPALRAADAGYYIKYNQHE
jgi:hypothetical protein